jgi:uncharacterized protein DUF953
LISEHELTSNDLYKQFEDSLRSFKPRSWTLVVFEGSPAEGLYSWCPDCIVASTHLRKLEKEVGDSTDNNDNASRNSLLPSEVKLLKFKVGSKKEWESESDPNLFKKNFPFLSDVPTAVLFFGRLDVMRMIAPRENDLQYIAERTKTYEDQIRSEDWHPPLKVR